MLYREAGPYKTSYAGHMGSDPKGRVTPFAGGRVR